MNCRPNCSRNLEEFESPTLTPVDPPTVHAASGGGDSLTEDEMVVLLRDTGWPEEVIPQALAVAWCESKWSPYASGDSGVSLGLFQIGVARPGWNGWFVHFGVDESLAYDALTNAQVARMIFERSGFAPWSCKP